MANFTVIDGVLAAIVLIGALVGLKTGLFKSVAKILKVIAAVYITAIITPLITEKWTRPFFTGKIQASIYNTIIEKCPDITKDTAGEALPGVLGFLAKTFKVDVNGAVSDAATGEDIVLSVSNAISVPVGNFVALAVTAVCLFIILLILLTLVIAILNNVISIGPLGVMNKLLGLAFGAVISMLIACLAATVISKIMPETSGGFVYNFFKNINPIEIISRMKIDK